MAPRSIRPVVGRKEMAAILGVHTNNSHRNKLPDLPASLQETYGDEIVDVAATPLWWRSDIEAYAEQRKIKKSND